MLLKLTNKKTVLEGGYEMKKYSVRFCDCGRVHFIDENKLNEVCETEKSVMHICNHCG